MQKKISIMAVDEGITNALNKTSATSFLSPNKPTKPGPIHKSPMNTRISTHMVTIDDAGTFLTDAKPKNKQSPVTKKSSMHIVTGPGVNKSFDQGHS